jgi:hypothetical protein
MASMTWLATRAQPFHPIDDSGDGLTRFPAKPLRGPDQMMGGQFLPCHMAVRVHRPDEEGDQGLVELEFLESGARFSPC